MRYLCPICETELTAKSFCPSCRKIVKEPLTYNGEFLPNESDPRLYSFFPDECDHPHQFGVPNEDPHCHQAEANKEQTWGKDYKGNHGGRITPTVLNNRGSASPVKTYSPAKDTREEQRRKSKKSAMISLLIIAIIYIIMFMRVLFSELIDEGKGFIENIIDEFTTHTETPADDWETVSVDEGETVSTLEAEKLKEQFEPCTGYVHYSLYIEDFVERISNLSKEYYDNVDINLQDDGYNLYYDDNYSYYEQYYVITLENDNYFESYYVTTDYVTGEIMEVYCASYEQGNCCINAAIAEAALSGLDSCNELIMDAANYFAEVENDEEYYYTDWNVSRAYVSMDDDVYYVFLDCLEENGKY